MTANAKLHLDLPSAETLIEVCEATWPAASVDRVGAWIVRDGQGGGKRVSAATENWPTTEADLPVAEKRCATSGKIPCFKSARVTNILTRCWSSTAMLGWMR